MIIHHVYDFDDFIEDVFKNHITELWTLRCTSKEDLKSILTDWNATDQTAIERQIHVFKTCILCDENIRQGFYEHCEPPNAVKEFFNDL